MIEKVLVPDVGEAQDVEVIEVLVSEGDIIAADDSLVVLESDKASMEIPSSCEGKVVRVLINEGDQVEEGSLLVEIETEGDAEPDREPEPEPEPEPEEKAETEAGESPGNSASQTKRTETPTGSGEPLSSEPSGLAPPPRKSEPPAPASGLHAGPAVRKQAREYGVELTLVNGSGRKGRVLKEDVQGYVKSRLQSGSGSKGGMGIPEIPEMDFTRWGEIEFSPLSRTRKASARNLHRSWLNVPHVTQFDEADITELEKFRTLQNEMRNKEGVKLTPLAFLIKAVVDALIRFPRFNSSMASDHEHLVLKKYYHIGIAVETEDGLVVPVLRDADSKGVVQLANESAELAAQARDKKLPMDAMQGATFTLSSLGGLGGTAFTPIVNAPEVAILGVSRSRVAPVFNGAEFEPRTLLPLSLSYDHRVIDGAEAARFTTYLASVLTDMRKILM